MMIEVDNGKRKTYFFKYLVKISKKVHAFLRYGVSNYTKMRKSVSFLDKTIVCKG